LSEEKLVRALTALASSLEQASMEIRQVLTEEFQQKEGAGEKVQQAFPEDLRNLLTFEDAEDAVLIKPRRFLGSENFGKVASIIGKLGGEYVSRGKESFFRVPKATGATTSQEPTEVSGQPTAHYSLEKITWQPANGPSGSYEVAVDDATENFKLLTGDLRKHGGRLSRAGFFVWLFQDGTRIGRKPLAQRKTNEAR